MNNEKTFVILGGNFVNVGAEAMTFVTVSSLREKYPNCRIVMISNYDALNDNSNLTFDVIGFSESVVKHAVASKIDIKYLAVSIAKKILRRGDNLKEYKKLQELLSICDGVFDISGYALSSQWSSYINCSKLRYVDLFCEHGIPFYFMPQSFGPFDYDENGDMIRSWIKRSLPRSKVIFVREKQGYEYLTRLIGKDRVKLSSDMVLQSNKVNVNLIYRNIPSVEFIDIKTNANVAIVPNMRNFDHGNKEDILGLYKDIINVLIANGRSVYLISHSYEDSEACSLIKAMFNEETSLILLESKINSFNFENLIEKFDFAVASRFHSIVHSYKVGVPCIALGWATKYHELLENVEQTDFIFDVRNNIDNKAVLTAVKHMLVSSQDEKVTIVKNVRRIQKSNCFTEIDF